MKSEVQSQTCTMLKAKISELMTTNLTVKPIAEELVALAKLDQKISQLESA